MFWIGTTILIVSLIVSRIIFFNRAESCTKESYVCENIIQPLTEGKVIVVDKMIVLSENKLNKYILFIQLKSRKIIEVRVSEDVFDSAKAGDYGIVEKINESLYGFKKVS